jgi:hypothetical protein
MTRERHVFDAGMVAHLWAHQTKDEARVSGRSNFFFCGDTIYSYGHHFPIAKHVKNKQKQAAVLFTTQSYSNTTAKHISIVRGAVQHLTVFHVQDVNSTDHRAQFLDYKKQIVELLAKVSRARTGKPWLMERVSSLVQEGNDFAKFWGLRLRIPPVENLDKLVAECNKIQKQQLAHQRQLAKEREREQAEALQKWADGETDVRPYDATVIRLRVRDDELQTSKGARVPLAHAVKAFKFVKACHDKHETYKRNGHTIHLGDFALDEIDENGNVRAGCHTVEWPEIERVAKQVGVA